MGFTLHQRRPPSVRQEREGCAGSSRCRFPVDNRVRILLSECTMIDTRLPFAVRPLRSPDTEDEGIVSLREFGGSVHPATGQGKTVRPLRCRVRTGSSEWNRTVPHGEAGPSGGERPGEIDCASGREQGFLAANDPVLVEPQAGLPSDPVDVVGRLESK